MTVDCKGILEGHCRVGIATGMFLLHSPRLDCKAKVHVHCCLACSGTLEDWSSVQSGIGPGFPTSGNEATTVWKRMVRVRHWNERTGSEGRLIVSIDCEFRAAHNLLTSNFRLETATSINDGERYRATTNSLYPAEIVASQVLSS